MGNQLSHRVTRARATEPTGSGTRARPGLLSLPHDVLLLIVQKLSVRGRVRLACCCKALYSCSDFFASVRLSPKTAKEAESLVTCLGPRCRAVRHLKLTRAPQAEFGFGDADAAEMEFDPDKYGCLAHLLGQLAGGPLESLNWSGERLLGSWALAALPRLRDCKMRATSFTLCTSHLSRSFSRLADLRRLSIDGSEWLSLDWEPGCLPSGLEELTLEGVCWFDPMAEAGDQDGDSVTAKIAAAASHATRLHSLTIGCAQMDEIFLEGDQPDTILLDGLGSMTHLRHLSLAGPGPMPDVAPLAALTGLQQLELSFYDGRDTQMGVQLQALTALSQLTSVAIQDVGLAELPRSIDAFWHSSTLKAVNLVRCPAVRRLAEALDGSSIEMLSLSPESVQAMGPCRLPSLHTLHINVCFYSPMPRPALAAACVSNVVASMHPIPPLLKWEYGLHSTRVDVQRGLAGHQGPPRCEFYRPSEFYTEEYYDSDYEIEEESEAEE